MEFEMFILIAFLATAFAQSVGTPSTSSVTLLQQLPCTMPVSDVTIVNINEVKPGLFAPRQRLMQEATARDLVKGSITARCTEELSDAAAKIIVAEATADQMRHGRTLEVSSIEGSNIRVATGDAALPFYGTYGSRSGRYDSSGRIGANAQALAGQRSGGTNRSTTVPTEAELKTQEKEEADALAARMRKP